MGPWVELFWEQFELVSDGSPLGLVLQGQREA